MSNRYRKSMREALEEMRLDEAKSGTGYNLYHKDFSSAMKHAYAHAKKKFGITISDDEISDKVATGPRKPSEGKTNKYRLKGDKGAIQVQVYNKGGSKPFELNMYKEEVELDEARKSQGMFIVLEKGSKNKVIGQFKEKDKAIEMMKKNAGSKVIQIGEFATEDDKPVDIKVGDNLSYTRVKLSTKIKEEVELDEGKMKDLVIKGQDLEMYAKKSGGIDKKDMMKVAAMLKKGDKSGALKYAKKMDTDPRDYILNLIGEEVELDEKLDKEDEPTVKKVVKMLKKASGAHAGQAKDLEKAVTEGDEIEEGKMSQLHQLMKDGKSAKEIAKIMKLDVKTIQALMEDDIELDEQETGPTMDPVAKAQDKVKKAKQATKVADLQMKVVQAKEEEVEIDGIRMNMEEFVELLEAGRLDGIKISEENFVELLEAGWVDKVKGLWSWMTDKDKYAGKKKKKEPKDDPWANIRRRNKEIQQRRQQNNEYEIDEQGLAPMKIPSSMRAKTSGKSGLAPMKIPSSMRAKKSGLWGPDQAPNPQRKIESTELDEMAPIIPVVARLLGQKVMKNVVQKTALPIITTAGKAAGAFVGAAAAKDMDQSKKHPKPTGPEEEKRNKEREVENEKRQKEIEQQHAANAMQTEASAYADARRAMASDPSTKQRFSKNISASDEDIKSADKNIIMQLRKVVSLKGVGTVTLTPQQKSRLKKKDSRYLKTAGSGFIEFENGKSEKIDLKMAQAILDKYNRLKKPFEKEQFQAKISKSKRDMLKALKEDIQIEKKQDSLREVKNLMKENRERYDG